MLKTPSLVKCFWELAKKPDIEETLENKQMYELEKTLFETIYAKWTLKNVSFPIYFSNFSQTHFGLVLKLRKLVDDNWYVVCYSFI